MAHRCVIAALCGHQNQCVCDNDLQHGQIAGWTTVEGTIAQLALLGHSAISGTEVA